MPFVSGYLIEGPVDPGYDKPGGGGRPANPIVLPPTYPGGGPVLPPVHIGGGPILPPLVVMPPIEIPPEVGGGPVLPPGIVWPPQRPPHVGGGPIDRPGTPGSPPERPQPGPPGQLPGTPGHPLPTPPPVVGGGPSGGKYLAMVILATDGGVIRTGWTVIDTSLTIDNSLPSGGGGSVENPIQPTPEPKPGEPTQHQGRR